MNALRRQRAAEDARGAPARRAAGAGGDAARRACRRPCAAAASAWRRAAPTRAAASPGSQSSAGDADWDAALDVSGEAPLAALRGGSEAARREAAEDTAGRWRRPRRGTPTVAGPAERWAKRGDCGLRLRCIENWLTDPDRPCGARRGPLSTEVRGTAALAKRASGLEYTRALCALLDAANDAAATLDVHSTRRGARAAAVASWRPGVAGAPGTGTLTAGLARERWPRNLQYAGVEQARTADAHHQGQERAVPRLHAVREERRTVHSDQQQLPPRR